VEDSTQYPRRALAHRAAHSASTLGVSLTSLRGLHLSTYELNVSTMCGLHTSTFQFIVISLWEI